MVLSPGRQLYSQCFVWYVDMHWCKQSSRWKSVFDMTCNAVWKKLLHSRQAVAYTFPLLWASTV